MPSTSDLIQAVKEWPARYFFALASVPGAALVVLATPLAVLLKVDSVDARWRLALLLTAMGLLVVGTVKGLTHLREKHRDTLAAESARITSLKSDAAARKAAAAEAIRQRLAFEQEMRSLTAVECEVLVRFVDHNTRTASFVFTDHPTGTAAAAQALAARGILTSLGTSHNAFFITTLYTINDTIFQFFRENMTLLDAGRKKSSDPAPKSGAKGKRRQR